MIGTARAAIEEAGNVIEDCNFYGGEWAIKTGRTSPGWQILLLDCCFEGQRTAAIETNDAGVSVIRCKFKNSPTGISVTDNNERLFVKDTWFENINKAALSIFRYFDPKTQINLENVKFSDVPVSLVYNSFGHGTSRTVKIPDNEVNGVVSYKATGNFYEMKDYSHGLILENNNSKELDRSFNTINIQSPIESLGEFPPKDIPDLPSPETWVNIVELGAMGDGLTDDTPVFKNAIEKYNSIYIPMGNYRLTETLKLKEKTSMIGLHPFMTRLILDSETKGFTDTINPRPLLITPKGGSTIIRGIGFDLNLNPGAIALKWMAGKQSYLDDIYFSTIYNVPKGTGQYYGIWITDGGGGIFKNIWAFNDRARNGFYVSNTKTEGKIYEISVEHHKDYEVKLDNVENWTFYNLQTEENGGSEKCIAVNIDNCRNLEFVNYVSYRIMAMGTPAFSAFEINNSKNIIIKGSHIYSGGAFPYDNSVFIKDNNVLVPALEFTLLNVNN
jgi:hypothetical protein